MIKNYKFTVMPGETIRPSLAGNYFHLRDISAASEFIIVEAMNKTTGRTVALMEVGLRAEFRTTESFDQLNITNSTQSVLTIDFVAGTGDYSASDTIVQSEIIPNSGFISGGRVDLADTGVLVPQNLSRKKVLIRAGALNVGSVWVNTTGNIGEGIFLFPADTIELDTTAAIYLRSDGGTLESPDGAFVVEVV